ncbi:MAG: ATP-binding protein [Thermodesulfovibrio sp.]|nr:ATP-binding protein [Thermodesulfovibrio sp.]
MRELLSEALKKINSASEALIKYYQLLEDKVKLLTEEVEQKKRLLSSIIESIDIAVVFFDRDGVIRLVNKAAEALFKINAQEVIGKRKLPIKIEDEKVYPLNSEKGFYAILSETEVFDLEGNRTGKVFLCKDITRIRELEAENERNRRLTAMGSLVTKIAHEIRNPLGSIELFANMIAEDLKDSIYGEYARRISTSVRVLRNTLENMLSFTKGINPKKELFCLNDLIIELKEEFKEFFSKVGVEINLDLQDKIEVFADYSLLKQAIVNLLVNAYQAMPEGGVITLSLTKDNDYAKIIVKDTGYGIDKEIIDRIFEPFFSTKDKGSGLGLSITHSIISAHEGKIQVSSELYKGTEFAIFIPQR